MFPPLSQNAPCCNPFHDLCLLLGLEHQEESVAPEGEGASASRPGKERPCHRPPPGGVALRASSFISGPRLSYLIHTCTVDVLRRLHWSPFPERAWLLVAFQLPRMPFTRSFLPLSLGSRGHLLSADMLLPFVVICPNQMGPISGPSHLGCSLQMGPHYWPPPPATHYPSLFLYLPL